MKTMAQHYVLFTFIAIFSFSTDAASNESLSKTSQTSVDFKLTDSDIRTYHQGDTIHYTSIIAGSGSALAGNLQQSINNTVTNPSGKKCLEHTISTTLTGVGGPIPITARLLYYQDQQNSLYECGHFDNKTSSYVFITDTPSTPNGVALSIQSPMKVGNTTSHLINYTNGRWKDCTRTVQSIEAVNTAVGVYEAYKITETCSNDADNSKTNVESWFVPSLYTVKESGTGEFIAGDFILEGFTFD